MTAVQPTPPSVQAARPRAAGAAAEQVDIKCSALTKIFKDFWLRNRVRAVDKIDIDVRRGEVFGLLGPNGSGKSTTIKMILGLLKPTSGRIAILGKRPEDVSTKRSIGYLPEESYLYRFLNARETLDYYGRLFYQSRDQRKRRIDMLLHMVGLEAVQRRPVGEYSKGMQRRIGLAQALINDPQLLILDEPTTGMDPIGTKQIKDLILELKGRGKTILLCSHLLSDVEDVCDRVAIMFGGRVRRYGTCDELLVQEQMTNIQTPQLDDATVEAIDRLLRERGFDGIIRREQPRQRLEALFLNIVAEAQASGAATSGATSGGRIAGFLIGEEAVDARAAEEVEPDTEEVIDDLIAGGEEPAPTETSEEAQERRPGLAAYDEEASEAPVDEADEVVDALVAGSSRDDRSSDDSYQAVDADAGMEPEDDEADLSVIDGLLGDEPARTAPPAAAPSAAEKSRKDAQDAGPVDDDEVGGLLSGEIDAQLRGEDTSVSDDDRIDSESDEQPDDTLRSSIDSMVDEDREPPARG